jgi:hypothetical protein
MADPLLYGRSAPLMVGIVDEFLRYRIAVRHRRVTHGLEQCGRIGKPGRARERTEHSRSDTAVRPSASHRTE